MLASNKKLIGVFMKNNIILIREDDEVVACCVPLDGDFVKEISGVDLFFNRIEEMESVGDLYKKLQEKYSQNVNIQIIDPRNAIYLVPKIIKEGIRNRLAIWNIFIYFVFLLLL